MERHAVFTKSSYTIGGGILCFAPSREAAEDWRSWYSHERREDIPFQIKGVDISCGMFLQRTEFRAHDGNGSCEFEDVVTYQEFVTNQRTLRRKAKADRRGYLTGRYNGYALDSRTVSVARGKVSCRDYRGGQMSITLTHEIRVTDPGFTLIPISCTSPLLR